MNTNKSLGQHWLFDKPTLDHICASGEVRAGDDVLEIGPGLGTLTHELLDLGAKVIAVELDKSLAGELSERFKDRDFELRSQDILKFNFNDLPKSYKIVANIPYYLTSHLLQVICETDNKPKKAALLLQKEVAERVSAIPGEMSLLAVSVQVYASASLGEVVPARLFTPPPKVDSRVLILDFFDQPLVHDRDKFFRVVKAGFANPRKKLRSSLAAGLRITAPQADTVLLKANIDPGRRAQTLSIEEWQRLANLVD